MSGSVKQKKKKKIPLEAVYRRKATLHWVDKQNLLRLGHALPAGPSSVVMLGCCNLQFHPFGHNPYFVVMMRPTEAQYKHSSESEGSTH